MAQNPLRNANRGNQIKSERGDIKQSITLYDVDYAIMTYLQDVVLPDLDENGKAVKVPVVYGNSERWEGARKNGVYRDQKGRIQLPILMMKRGSVEKNTAMAMLNRHVSYPAIQRWSKENRYDRFSLLGNTSPVYKVYNITMPDYVTITYECMAWTNYMEHLNVIVEALTWASDEYWGDKTKYKFITTTDNYTIVNEVSEGGERVNRVEFNLNVNAYLLPEKFDGENTTKAGYSIGRVVFSTETDLTANGRMENFLRTPTEYNANKDVEDYLTLNTTLTGNPPVANQITFSGIKIIKAPGVLYSATPANLTVDGINYDVKVYKNVTKLTQATDFTFTYSGNVLSITLTASTSDEISLVGKFITL